MTETETLPDPELTARAMNFVLEYFEAHRCLPGGMTDCTLCYRRGQLVGFFLATREASKRLGAPQGKCRMVPYLICRKHLELPRQELIMLVEKQIFNDIAEGRYSWKPPTDEVN